MPNSNDLLLIAVIIAFMAFVFFNGRKQKAAQAKLKSSAQVGSKAIMLGGVVGTIKSIDDAHIVIETTPGTKITFLKAALRQVVEPSLDDVKVAAPKKPATATAAKKPAAKKPAAKAPAKAPAKKSAK